MRGARPTLMRLALMVANSTLAFGACSGLRSVSISLFTQRSAYVLRSDRLLDHFSILFSIQRWIVPHGNYEIILACPPDRSNAA